MSIALYEIADDLREIEALIEDAGGEITKEIEARLAEIEGDFAAKVERIVHVIHTAKIEADAFKAEAERVAAKAKARERKADSLKRYVLAQMLATGQQRVQAGLFTVRTQRASRPSIRWTLDPSACPESFVRVVPERREIDKDAAYQAWKAGDALPEGFAVEVSTFIRID